MKKISSIIGLLLVGLLFCSNAFSEALQKNVPEDTLRYWSDKVDWREAGPNLPKGTKIAVLEGNPKESGMFTIRLKTPKNMILAVHQHPGPERVTILEGEIYVGFGEKFNKDIATQFVQGSFYVNPANESHYVYTKNHEAIIQITGMGPWKVIYEN